MTLAPETLDAPPEVIEAITAAALDYVEAYVQGDADRHARAYHPECLKRRLIHGADGIAVLQVVSPQRMVDTAASGSTIDPAVEAEVVIDAVDENIASVRIYSTKWVDYIHMVNARGAWRLFHVAWRDRDE